MVNIQSATAEIRRGKRRRKKPQGGHKNYYVCPDVCTCTKETVAYNTTQPSSASLERLFNSTGLTETPYRNELTDKMSEILFMSKMYGL